MEISIHILWQRIAETILSKQLGCTWKFPYTSFGREYLKLLCLSNWDVHGHFHRHLVAKNILSYFLQATGMYMEVSIDTLWQRISETISSKQLGCTWKFPYKSCGREYLKLLCLGNWDVHGNFHRYLVAKNI